MIVDQATRIDRLAKAVYGTEQSGTVEAILDANPGLAAQIYIDGVIPAGTEITLPEAVAPARPAVVRPWD